MILKLPPKSCVKAPPHAVVLVAFGRGTAEVTRVVLGAAWALRVAGGKTAGRCLALAENEGCDADAEHGNIGLVSTRLFVLSWWIQGHLPGQDWCVRNGVLLVCGALWQSELAAQSLEVGLSPDFNCVLFFPEGKGEEGEL